jgi:hypothetical protein
VRITNVIVIIWFYIKTLHAISLGNKYSGEYFNLSTAACGAEKSSARFFSFFCFVLGGEGAWRDGRRDELCSSSAFPLPVFWLSHSRHYVRLAFGVINQSHNWLVTIAELFFAFLAFLATGKFCVFIFAVIVECPLTWHKNLFFFRHSRQLSAD